MRLKDIFGLYSLNGNQIRQNWNFNRFFLLLSYRLRVADSPLTAAFSRSRDSALWELSSRIYGPIWRSRKSDESASPEVLVVAQHGRFGNMIRQVSLAIATAEKLGIREVIVKAMPDFPRGTWVLDNGVALTHDSLLRPRMIARPRHVLGGDFFVKPRLPVDVQDVDFDVIASSLLEAGGLIPSAPLPAQTMVIHFRSGDAFAPVPHPGLGQPPLSFYRVAIDNCEPEHVILVFENYENPVIEGVVELLNFKGIGHSIQSGSFREDLEVLLGATTLVTAHGTLTEALLLLSPHVSKWISFSKDPQLYFRRRRIESIVSVWDPAGDYSSEVLQGNWRNTESQRDLMVTFPPEKLALVERPARK
jgi:hypothetical protein